MTVLLAGTIAAAALALTGIGIALADRHAALHDQTRGAEYADNAAM